VAAVDMLAAAKYPWKLKRRSITSCKTIQSSHVHFSEFRVSGARPVPGLAEGIKMDASGCQGPLELMDGKSMQGSLSLSMHKRLLARSAHVIINPSALHFFPVYLQSHRYPSSHRDDFYHKPRPDRTASVKGHAPAV
jgi:hypothetical protein